MNHIYSGWFCERRSGTPFLDVLSHRIEAITQIKVWPFHGIHSSECYQVKSLKMTSLYDSSSLTNEKDHHYFLNSADVCW